MQNSYDYITEQWHSRRTSRTYTHLNLMIGGVMTSAHKVLATLVLISLSLSVLGQSKETENNRFAVDGLTFEYPKTLSITDESTHENQQTMLTRRGSSVQFMVVAQRKPTLQQELPGALNAFTEALVKKASIVLGQNKMAVRSPISRSVGSVDAEGVRLQTSEKNRSRTAEIIWLRTRFRLVGLVYISNDSDEASSSTVWEILRGGLKIDSPVIMGTTTNPDETDNQNITGGVLNGRALNLPTPPYSPLARAAHASGEVQVQVLIDELGNVISAHAISGHPLLQAACVQAARQAKFSPTMLEGEPVRVTGVIKYNFVAR
jgi:TonB family protein